MKIIDTPLVSRDVSKRASEESLLKKTQQKQMKERLVDQPAHGFHSSVAASTDTYIAEALKKVRQSDVTHSEALTRMSGTWFHNQKMNSSEENK
jgi:hypothetical protein